MLRRLGRNGGRRAVNPGPCLRCRTTVAEADAHAPRLLEMADGARSLEECAALIGEEFDTDRETIERDLLRFASELVENGIAGVVGP